MFSDEFQIALSQFIKDWGILILAAAFFIYRAWRNKTVKNQLPELKSKGAVIVDVRSPEEFKMGSAPGSVNIPVSDLPRRLGELDKTKPVVLCCASGMRASTAAAMLKAQGFAEVVNVGPWQNAVV
jgi:phage shock protein E